MDENKTNHECECGEDKTDHECGCGCGCDEEVEMMHLVLDDDTEVDCYVIGVFDVKDQEYIALLPEDTEDVLIYRYSESDEGPELDNIEDDEEYEEVGKVFDEIFAEEFEDEE